MSFNYQDFYGGNIKLSTKKFLGMKDSEILSELQIMSTAIFLNENNMRTFPVRTRVPEFLQIIKTSKNDDVVHYCCLIINSVVRNVPKSVQQVLAIKNFVPTMMKLFRTCEKTNFNLFEDLVKIFIEIAIYNPAILLNKSHSEFVQSLIKWLRNDYTRDCDKQSMMELVLFLIRKMNQKEKLFLLLEKEVILFFSNLLKGESISKYLFEKCIDFIGFLIEKDKHNVEASWLFKEKKLLQLMISKFSDGKNDLQPNQQTLILRVIILLAYYCDEFKHKILEIDNFIQTLIRMLGKEDEKQQNDLLFLFQLIFKNRIKCLFPVPKGDEKIVKKGKKKKKRKKKKKWTLKKITLTYFPKLVLNIIDKIKFPLHLWYWEDDFHKYNPYDELSNLHVETCFRRGDKKCQIKIGQGTYEIDFTTFKQYNISSRLMRNVKRDPIYTKIILKGSRKIIPVQKNQFNKQYNNQYNKQYNKQNLKQQLQKQKLLAKKKAMMEKKKKGGGFFSSFSKKEDVSIPYQVKKKVSQIGPSNVDDDDPFIYEETKKDVVVYFTRIAEKIIESGIFEKLGYLVVFSKNENLKNDYLNIMISAVYFLSTKTMLTKLEPISLISQKLLFNQGSNPQIVSSVLFILHVILERDDQNVSKSHFQKEGIFDSLGKLSKKHPFVQEFLKKYEQENVKDCQSKSLKTLVSKLKKMEKVDFEKEFKEIKIEDVTGGALVQLLLSLNEYLEKSKNREAFYNFFLQKNTKPLFRELIKKTTMTFNYIENFLGFEEIPRVDLYLDDFNSNLNIKFFPLEEDGEEKKKINFNFHNVQYQFDGLCCFKSIETFVNQRKTATSPFNVSLQQKKVVKKEDLPKENLDLFISDVDITIPVEKKIPTKSSYRGRGRGGGIGGKVRGRGGYGGYGGYNYGYSQKKKPVKVAVKKNPNDAFNFDFGLQKNTKQTKKAYNPFDFGSGKKSSQMKNSLDAFNSFDFGDDKKVSINEPISKIVPKKIDEKKKTTLIEQGFRQKLKFNANLDKIIYDDEKGLTLYELLLKKFEIPYVYGKSYVIKYRKAKDVKKEVENVKKLPVKKVVEQDPKLKKQDPHKLKTANALLDFLVKLHEVNNHEVEDTSGEKKFVVWNLSGHRKPILDNNVFINKFLSYKIMHQYKTPEVECLSISNSLPKWFVEMFEKYSFVVDQYTKLFSLKFNHFREIQANKKKTNNQKSQANLALKPKTKIQIQDRSTILKEAMVILGDYASEKCVLEFEYKNEEGIGLGPSLAFYTLCSREVQRTSLNIWMNSSDNESQFVQTQVGLFPQFQKFTKEQLQFFRFVGRLFGKSIVDDRIVDLPFSKPLYRLILGKEISMEDIQLVDTFLYNSVKSIEKLTSKEDVSSMYLSMEHNGVELVEGGGDIDVTLDNKEEYLSLLKNFVLKKCLKDVVGNICAGINDFVSLKKIRIFSEHELSEYFQPKVEWIREDLFNSIILSKGYSKQSERIVDLIDILTSELTPDEQKDFLEFLTGSRQLPYGGFHNLKPKISIVRVHEKKDNNKCLPTCNTCFRKLKLPLYSSKDVLRKNLKIAISHGRNTFHFS